MFEPVSSRLNINLLEEEILRFWKQNDVFHQSMTSREGGPEYVFFEGPPTANGKPGVHHVLARVFKDMFPRYKSMNGFHVSRRGGWDTHGLRWRLRWKASGSPINSKLRLRHCQVQRALP